MLPDSRARLLLAAVGFALVPPAEPELRLLQGWLAAAPAPTLSACRLTGRSGEHDNVCHDCALPTLPNGERADAVARIHGSVRELR